MKNFVQPGNVLTLAAPTGGVKSGDPVLVGAIFGVATTDAAEAADVEVATVGVFTLPKDSSTITQGALVYWDTSAAKITTTSTDNTLVGKAIEAAGTGVATVAVLIR